MVALSDLTVEVRDKTLKRVGLIPPEDLVFGANLAFNNVGDWTVTLPIEHKMCAPLRAPGSGIIVTGPSDTILSGPMVQPLFSANGDDPWGSITFTGVTDDVILLDRLAFPQPGNANATTQNVAKDKRTGAAEDVMHAFVSANIGPGGTDGRRDTRLVMGTNLHRGVSVTKSARFAQLGPLLTETAGTSNMGFRVIQRGTTLAFETFAIVDRSAMVRLDIWQNTLDSQSLAITGPTATRVIVGGDGEDTSRAFYVGTTVDSTQGESDWGRVIERFVDSRQSDDTNEYATAASEVLNVEGITQVAAQVVPTDDTVLRFGRDWNLGDYVSAIIDTGEYKATVTGAVIKADPDGARLGVTLGDAAKLAARSQALAKVSALSRRIDSLERGL